jgi:hypothetical protein
MRRRLLVSLIVGLLVAALGPAAAVGAGRCHVVKFNASGSFAGSFSSLQDAIGGGDVSDTGSTLRITGTCHGPVGVFVSMNLVGLGPATLDGGNPQAVLSTSPGTTVNITNLRIKDGSSSLGIAGLVNSGVMHLKDSSVTGNDGCNGGISNAGTLTIENSTVSGNTSPFNCGGAIFNTGDLTVIDSSITGNSGGIGGIANGGTLNVTNSSIDGNTSLGYGGGVYNWGTATIAGSTVSGNNAAFGGGGISNTAFATMTVTDSIVSGNSAGLGGGGVINGGGINNSGALILTRSTVSGNSATFWGGGILNIGGFGGSLNVNGSWIGAAGAPNSSGSLGGGIFNYGSVVAFFGQPTTIAFNNAGVLGGGIYQRSLSSTTPTPAPVVICGSPSLVVYGAGNTPDNSFDEAMGSNTICP